MIRYLAIILLLAWAASGWAQIRDRAAEGPKTIIGPRNPDLQDGAQELLMGRAESGVELTLRGYKVAAGPREKEAALSNLCAGYIMLEQFDEALKYCELLLARNDRNWRAYNNRAVIYINTKQYEKAHQDLLRGEELNPGARTLRIARAMYLDAVDPVEPQIEIDDRRSTDREEHPDP